MKRYLTMSPEGTRDYLFEESRARTHVEQTLANVFSSRAFCRVVTPTLEYFDLFSADCVGFSAEEVYKLVDRKGRILALRARFHRADRTADSDKAQGRGVAYTPVLQSARIQGQSAAFSPVR